MEIERLKSGSYRIRQRVNRTRYSVTVPYKPTKRQAEEIIKEKLEGKLSSKGFTFHRACLNYINAKDNVLSPKTVREYTLQAERYPEWFSNLLLYKITKDDVQQCINEITPGRAYSTVKDYLDFIFTILRYSRKDIDWEITLPQKKYVEIYIPSEDDIKSILEYTYTYYKKYYVGLCLACMGLRRGEICALTLDDLDDNNVIHINKDLVQNIENAWVTKEVPKTTMSAREIYIPEDVAQLIREQGYIYNNAPGRLTKYLHSTQTKLGIPQFPLHKCRHYFASKLMENKVDLRTIQEAGGWSGSETVSRIYQHSLKMKNQESKKEMFNELADSFIVKPHEEFPTQP